MTVQASPYRPGPKPRPPAKPPRPPLFTPAKLRALLYQVILLAVVVGAGWYLVDNTATNLEQQNIASGYGFLETPAGFGIGETVVEYDSRCLRPLPDPESSVVAVDRDALPGLFPDLPAARLRRLSDSQMDVLLETLPADDAGRPFVRADRIVERPVRGQQETFLQDTSICDYAQALEVGFWNTIRVSVLGILLATIIGLVMGVARLSGNWLLRRIGDVYVETMRNIPLLLLLFVWYGVLTVSLPLPRDAISVGEITAEDSSVVGAVAYLSNRGLKIAWPTEPGTEAAATLEAGGLTLTPWEAIGLALAAAVVFWFLLGRLARRLQMRTGAQIPVGPIGLAAVILAPVITGLVYIYHLEVPPDFDLPVKSGFNFVGGATLTPEFLALLIGLATYTGAFIAEVVRSGILAVAKGQKEAAAALGLRPGVVLNKVVLPQALRVIIPPTTNQYLNLTKNSSLAVAIGYPDLVNIGNTTANQTGQAIEAVSIFMAVYLSLSLLISLIMNWYNARIALKER